MTAPLFASLGIVHPDHVAVTTSSLDAALADYLALPGARLMRGPGNNDVQRVRYAFVRLAEGMVIEILEPLAESPIRTHVQRGGGTYHLCHAVLDIVHAAKQARIAGAREVVPPTPDPAFDGRRVAFFHHPLHGLFELVELALAVAAERPPAATPSPSVAASRSGVPSADISERLRRVFRQVFSDLPDAEIESATFGQTRGWDSLTHLQLVGQLEIDFGVTVPADAIGSLTSFARMLEFVGR